MTLQSGTYAVKNAKRVVTWKAPDKDGDGAEVWVAKTDAVGNQIGRVRETDQWGNVKRHYRAPAGFQNRPGYDHTDNYVLLDEYGQDVYRTPTGEAVSLRPGQGVVINADGSVEYLEDEYAQFVFEETHDVVELGELEVPEVPEVGDIMSLPVFEE